MFAYQTKQQAGFSLKYLVPLTAIGSAYVWRDGPGVELLSCALNSGCDWPRAKICLSASCRDFSIKEERPYGKATGVIWLQTNCQPEGVFAKTMVLWNWPLVALPLY